MFIPSAAVADDVPRIIAGASVGVEYTSLGLRNSLAGGYIAESSALTESAWHLGIALPAHLIVRVEYEHAESFIKYGDTDVVKGGLPTTTMNDARLAVAWLGPSKDWAHLYLSGAVGYRVTTADGSLWHGGAPPSFYRVVGRGAVTAATVGLWLEKSHPYELAPYALVAFSLGLSAVKGEDRHPYLDYPLYGGDEVIAMPKVPQSIVKFVVEVGIDLSFSQRRSWSTSCGSSWSQVAAVSVP